MDIENLFNEQKYNEIIDYFIKNKPESRNEFLLLAISYYNLNDLQQALNILKEAFEKYNDDKEIVFNIVEILYQMGNLDSCVNYINYAINIDPNNYVYYDILADYYKINLNFEKAFQMALAAIRYAPVDIREELINKYLSYFNINKQIYDKQISGGKNSFYFKKNEESLNLLMVGSGCHYADSIKFLQEKGWKIYVLKTDTWKAFYPNYSLLKSMGATLIEKEEIDEFLESYGSKIDVVFRTGYFYGGNELYRSLGTSDIEQINLFYYISTKIKEMNKNALSILAFDGDTFLTDKFWIDWLKKRLEICDYIFTDTNNLKDYIEFNTKFDKNKILKLRVEFPNKSDIFINMNGNFKYKIIQIGRYLGDYIPVAPIFIDTISGTFQIGRGDNIITVNEDRLYFAKKYSDYAFGLGHFYDFYLRNAKFNECIEYKNSDLMKSTSNGYNYPMIYGYTNVAGKITTYLQYGIIPIIPNDDNDFHRELIDNGLAVGIERNQYFFDPFDFSNYDIKSFRERIANNLDLFTSDGAYELINKLVLSKK